MADSPVLHAGALSSEKLLAAQKKQKAKTKAKLYQDFVKPLADMLGMMDSPSATSVLLAAGDSFNVLRAAMTVTGSDGQTDTTVRLLYALREQATVSEMHVRRLHEENARVQQQLNGTIATCAALQSSLCHLQQVASSSSARFEPHEPRFFGSGEPSQAERGENGVTSETGGDEDTKAVEAKTTTTNELAAECCSLREELERLRDEQREKDRASAQAHAGALATIATLEAERERHLSKQRAAEENTGLAEERAASAEASVDKLKRDFEALKLERDRERKERDAAIVCVRAEGETSRQQLQKSLDEQRRATQTAEAGRTLSEERAEKAEKRAKLVEEKAREAALKHKQEFAREAERTAAAAVALATDASARVALERVCAFVGKDDIEEVMRELKKMAALARSSGNGPSGGGKKASKNKDKESKGRAQPKRVNDEDDEFLNQAVREREIQTLMSTAGRVPGLEAEVASVKEENASLRDKLTLATREYQDALIRLKHLDTVGVDTVAEALAVNKFCEAISAFGVEVVSVKHLPRDSDGKITGVENVYAAERIRHTANCHILAGLGCIGCWSRGEPSFWSETKADWVDGLRAVLTQIPRFDEDTVRRIIAPFNDASAKFAALSKGVAEIVARKRIGLMLRDTKDWSTIAVGTEEANRLISLRGLRTAKAVDTAIEANLFAADMRGFVPHLRPIKDMSRAVDAKATTTTTTTTDSAGGGGAAEVSFSIVRFNGDTPDAAVLEAVRVATAKGMVMMNGK